MKNWIQNNMFRTIGLNSKRCRKQWFENKNCMTEYNNILELTTFLLMHQYHKEFGIAGTKGAYHLDHRFSIAEGYKQNVSPEIIGNIKNLEFIPWRKNCSKGSKCSVTLIEIGKE